MMIDLEDSASLEKLGQALLKNSSFVVSFTKKIMSIPESRDVVLDHIKESYDSQDFKNAVDTAIILSDNKILPRLRTVEKDTGNYVFEEWEEHAPTLPEQITELREYIKTADFCLNLPNSDNIIPETKTGKIAYFIKDFLENDLKERNGQFSLNGTEIKDMIVRVIPAKDPELTPKEGQNIRKLKKDVLGKLKDILGNRVKIDKNKNGRHETRILYKPLQTVTS